MSDKRKRRVELRIVEAAPPAAADTDDGDGGGHGGGGSGSGGAPDAERPVVQIIAGWRTTAIDEAERYLVKRDKDLFQRGREVVRVAPLQIDIGDGQRGWALAIVAVASQHMRERFTRAVDLQRFDKRAKDWASVDCPKDFAEAYLERYGWWRLPVLRGVVTAPTLRTDGTLLDRPGYDQRSQLYFDPRGVVFPAVAAAPTRADALAALDYVDELLLATFDFVSPAARSVALSGIMTALLRPAMAAAPLHAFSAPLPGAGKSKLVNIAAVIRLGHQAPVMALGERQDESEKRLGALLIAGDPIIAIDNVERALSGELLDQLITEPVVLARVLGRSENVKVPNIYCVFATGNNLKFGGDMRRRVLLGELDPRCERPELREFATPDPVWLALRERPKLVSAILTIARAFFLAGCPQDAAPLGSFAGWSRWVRDPLLWLDRADPVETMGAARAEDTQLMSLAAVLHQWRAVLGDNAVTAREVIAAAETPAFGGGMAHADLRDALLAVAGDAKGLSPRRLGQWLGYAKGRGVDGMRLDRAGAYGGVVRWQVTSTAMA
jgi:putative DNA primase/helicase